MNFWDYKPWWCQPWSILLTGGIAIALSWLLVRSLWLTVLVTIPVLLWWLYFLILVPLLVQNMDATGKESDRANLN